MNSAFVKTLETLKQVYGEKAFSAQALNKALALCHARERALVTRLVYGVLDEDIRLQYLISKYVKKRPKGDTLIILKMGVYCLGLSMPVYAVVNDCAELAKTTGGRASGGVCKRHPQKYFEEHSEFRRLSARRRAKNVRFVFLPPNGR